MNKKNKKISFEKKINKINDSWKNGKKIKNYWETKNHQSIEKNSNDQDSLYG